MYLTSQVLMDPNIMYNDPCRVLLLILISDIFTQFYDGTKRQSHKGYQEELSTIEFIRTYPLKPV